MPKENPPGLPAELTRPDAQAVIDALNLRIWDLERANKGEVTTLPTTGLSAGKTRAVYKAATGVYWEMLYTGEETYPWAKIGGPPLVTASNVQRNLTNQTTFVSLATDPLNLTLPLAGDYDVTVEALIAHIPTATGQLLGRVSYSVGGTAASNDWGAGVLIEGAASERIFTDTGKQTRWTSLAKETKVEEKALTGGNYEVAFTRRRLRIDPVRVG